MLAFTYTPLTVGELESRGLCLFTDADAVDVASGEQSLSFAIKGICGSGQLSVSGPLTFPPVIVGRRATQRITLQNQSLVNVHYRLSHDGGPSITLQPTEVCGGAE